MLADIFCNFKKINIMKRLFIFIFLLFSSLLFFGNVVKAKGLQAVCSFSSFNTPNNKPFVESYLSISGRGITYKKTENGKFQGSIQVILTASKNGEAVYNDKYNLLTPEQTDTSNLSYNFIDQKRFELANGVYVLTITLNDNYSPANMALLNETITVNYIAGKTSISDATLLESFSKTKNLSGISKNGFDLVPMVNNFYPNEFKNFRFYVEVYPSGVIAEKEPYLVSYAIEDFENGTKVDPFGKFSKLIAQPANPIIGEFAIETLPTGNYNLTIEVFSSKNELIASKKTFFQRLNTSSTTSINIDNVEIENSFVAKYTELELIEHIKSLDPISNEKDKLFAANLLAKPELDYLKKYLLSFWQKKHGPTAEKEWEKYQLNVITADQKFAYGKTRGYQTARGGVFLRHGPASVVNRNDGKNDISIPYEIWIYNKLGQNQTNKKFVFANFQDLASSRFELIHSTAIGEIKDEKWQGLILNRAAVSSLRTRDFKEEDTNNGDSRGLNQLKRDFE